MKAKLLVINHVYLLFGATLYAGVLWALKFFWYPSWQTVTLAVVHDQFILPTTAATNFFTIVVPIMFVANIVLIVTEWKTPFRIVSFLALACITTSTIVGKFIIIPINEQIGAGLSSQDQLTQLLQRWMSLNDIRWVAMTSMWLILVYYFVKKGNLLTVLTE